MQTLENPRSVTVFLRTVEDIQLVCIDGQLVHFTHIGDRVNEAKLLRQLIEADFEIAEFRSQQESLEDVFLGVTSGVVQ